MTVRESPDELRRKILALRERMGIRVNADRPARAVQAIVGGYVGVRLRPPPPLDDHPLAKVWIEHYTAECRRLGRSPGLTTVCMEACRLAGLSITSKAKANKKCERALIDAGRPDWFRWAKRKSGRKS